MYFIYLCAKITRNVKITLDNMVFAVSAADWAADEPAALAHFAVTYAALAAAYCRQHGTFKQPLQINHQIKVFGVQQRAHSPEIMQLIAKAHFIKFYLIKINNFVNNGRVRQKACKLRVHQPRYFRFWVTPAQRVRKRQRVQYVTQRAHFNK